MIICSYLAGVSGACSNTCDEPNVSYSILLFPLSFDCCMLSFCPSIYVGRFLGIAIIMYCFERCFVPSLLIFCGPSCSLNERPDIRLNRSHLYVNNVEHEGAELLWFLLHLKCCLRCSCRSPLIFGVFFYGPFFFNGLYDVTSSNELSCS